MKKIAIAEWGDLKDRKPAYALVANVDSEFRRFFYRGPDDLEKRNVRAVRYSLWRGSLKRTLT